MENEDNETTLRLRQLRGETPGPAAAHQEARDGPDTQRRDGPDVASRDARTTLDARAGPDAGAAREAKEPAPGDANPTSDPEGRPLDRRTRSP